jgi:hypothetical protein
LVGEAGADVLLDGGTCGEMLTVRALEV